MSIEQRDMRPFSPVDALDRIADAIRLRVGDELLEPGGGKILDESVYLHTPVNVVLPGRVVIEEELEAARADLERLDLAADDVKFVVVMSSGYLKLLDFAAECLLGDLSKVPSEIHLTKGGRPRALQAPHGGCTIEVLFYLANEKPKKTGRPWRYATWLAKSTFELATEQAFRGFTPKPLTAAEKAARALSPKTVRYITLDNNSPIEPDLTEDLVEVWIDSDLLAQMSVAPKSKSSVALQRQFFVDAVAAVVSAAVALPGIADLGWSEIKETILGRVISMVAPSNSKPEVRESACKVYLDMLKTNPPQFMSYVEAAAGLSTAFEAQMEA